MRAVRTMVALPGYSVTLVTGAAWANTQAGNAIATSAARRIRVRGTEGLLAANATSWMSSELERLCTNRIERRGRCVLLDHVGRLLADHDRRCIRIAAHHARHD